MHSTSDRGKAVLRAKINMSESARMIKRTHQNAPFQLNNSIYAFRVVVARATPGEQSDLIRSSRELFFTHNTRDGCIRIVFSNSTHTVFLYP